MLGLWGSRSAFIILNLVNLVTCLSASYSSKGSIWRNPEAPLGDRVQDLVSQLTVQEMISSLDGTTNPTGAIPRLGIPGFTGWNECLHGGVDLGETHYGMTLFPQPLGLAAAFDPPMLHEIAGIISEEMRAASNMYRQADGTARLLNCFSPNINLVRDPRWGRNSETYGEDPHLTAELAKAFVTGLQGNDSRYVKTSATCKHFAAYSLEAADSYTRHTFNAEVSERDMEASYTPAFKACVEAGARSVMCSYNAVHGKPSCANPELLQGLLRDRWEFDGFVVSDCGAVNDITWPHQFTNTSAEGNAAALRAGTDMACTSYADLLYSYVEGLVNRSHLETAVGRVMAHKFRLGVMDPPAEVPFTRIPGSIIGSPPHLLKAIQAAQRGIVLLKNRALGNGRSRLPLNPLLLKKVVLAGPHATSSENLLGNYYGKPSGPITTPLQAFQNALGSDKVVCVAGNTPDFGWQEADGADGRIDEVTRQAMDADAVILFLGTSQINSHTTDTAAYHTQALHTEGEGDDRISLRLPGVQEVLALQVARMSGTPVIVVLVHGGPLDVQVLQEAEGVDAILTAWFPGQGGQAIADVVLGITPPSGRLPTTFYYENYTSQIKMSEMDMRAWPGRTHRYLQVPVLYPFGHGLSYTTWAYSGLQAVSLPPLQNGQPRLRVEVSLQNTGDVESDEVVLAYLTCKPRRTIWRRWQEQGTGHRALGGFRRISLGPGDREVVTMEIGGDNLHNMLPKPGQNSPATVRGNLEVEVQGMVASLPQNIECLLTDRDFAKAQ